MTCPDNLLISARRGTLAVEERARLDAHLARCAMCRLALRGGLDLDDELQTMPGDDLIAARIAKNLAPKLVPAKPLTPARRSLFLIAAAVGLLACVGLAAAASMAARQPSARPEIAPPRVVPHVDPRPVRAAPIVEEPAADPVPVIEAPVVRETPPASAADLFAQANARRRDGDPRRAQSLYRELQRRYPRSPEAEVSRVSLGRVLLELGDPSAALGQFDRYLADEPRGALAEEAMFGKASALGRLGRDADERRTWEALLSAFPGSVYADRARARLSAPR